MCLSKFASSYVFFGLLRKDKISNLAYHIFPAKPGLILLIYQLMFESKLSMGHQIGTFVFSKCKLKNAFAKKNNYVATSYESDRRPSTVHRGVVE